MLPDPPPLPVAVDLLPYEARLDERPLAQIDLAVIHCTELPDMATAREFGERVLYASGTGNSGHYYIDRDGTVLGEIGERVQEQVDRRVLGTVARARQEVQDVVGNAHLHVGGDDVDAVAFDRHPLGGLDDLHAGSRRQEHGQCALVLRRQVLHQDDRQAGVRRQRLQHLGEGFQPSRRRADAV